MIVFNKTQGLVLADQVRKADTFSSRLVGLLDRKSLESGEGLWIAPCAMVHTFFMAFPIDLVFLDKENRVVRIVGSLSPWRMSPWVFRAHSVLELVQGRARGNVSVGDVLEIKESSDS